MNVSTDRTDAAPGEKKDQKASAATRSEATSRGA